MIVGAGAGGDLRKVRLPAAIRADSKGETKPRP